MPPHTTPRSCHPTALALLTVACALCPHAASGSEIVAWGLGAHGETTPPEDTDLIAVSAGDFHGLALKTDGSIVGWGSNASGQTAPQAGNDVVAVAAGGSHSLALKVDGSIIGWGSNSSGLATPPVGNGFTAIAAHDSFNLALRSDGSIAAWGADGFYGRVSDAPTGTGFVAISSHWSSLLDSVAPNGRSDTWLTSAHCETSMSDDRIPVEPHRQPALIRTARGSIDARSAENRL